MASAPPSHSSSPPSLKGITSTNDDPDACAFCSSPLVVDAETKAYGAAVICCGKRICLDCNDPDRTFIGPGRAKRCSFCGIPAIIGDKGRLGALKKHAKKGAAWGQHMLGYCYRKGEFVSQSDYYEAKRWYEKAAKQGHPGAILSLGMLYLEGRGGCSTDLSKARELAEMVMSLYPLLANRCICLLCMVAERLDSTEAKSILLPLAEEGYTKAQCELGITMCNEGDIMKAKRWLEAAALQRDSTSVYNTLLACTRLKNMAETSFWFNIFSRSEMMPPDQEAKKCVETIGRKLRMLRDSCGECGTDLEGTDACIASNAGRIATAAANARSCIGIVSVKGGIEASVSASNFLRTRWQRRNACIIVPVLPRVNARFRIKTLRM
eukprot:CAMPEP_0178571800 /NCGR_PEP_ID=MMETSP0697-20121206/17857_1 /TAXON_ID=265572 /ORGANISM="Extubocellulus spinifer, Strain CCMP396" /LENGTH=379 /DNA_ID=CAMNT_0020206435 /DNA_START=133 /DNA_END=1273 /DNA_ORIENTATION=+